MGKRLIKHLPPSKLHMPPTEKWSGGLTLDLFLECGKGQVRLQKCYHFPNKSKILHSY